MVHDIHILPTDAISVWAPAWKLVGESVLQPFRAATPFIGDSRRLAAVTSEYRELSCFIQFLAGVYRHTLQLKLWLHNGNFSS